MIRRALPILVLAAAMIAGGVLAVGASGRSAHAAAAKKLTFKAKSSALRFTKGHYTVKAGTYRVTMINPSAASFPHALEITRSGKETKTPKLKPGKRAAFTIKLRKGTYKFYCPVDGHHAAGMKGTLTVK